MDDHSVSDILDLLACPDDGGRMVISQQHLRCTHCGKIFEIRGGIPLLYPDDLDRRHLEQEEKLGEQMQHRTPPRREESYQREWEKSKEEFWSFVREKTSSGGMTILNAGCGIDTHFLRLGEDNKIIAFDLMHGLLRTLRAAHGSPNNIAGDIHALPFRHGSVDALCCIDLIHHESGDLRRILRSFHDTLKLGGMLFLEDVNAWGVFQFWKSILLPRPAHAALRSAYHRLKGSTIQPAEYEFPTSVWRVGKLLEETGFTSVEAIPLRSYPLRTRFPAWIYRSISKNERISRYHNFHYFFFAVKR
ncbi:MAG: methyltransferase domain-containing protein [Candidatus Krumholzibacteriota bacterium]|nr:methyltransferase domain-containing protein [Candidatus Krumholzibacteriota bacterium]